MHKLFLAHTSVDDLDPLAFVEAAAEAGYDGVGLRLHPSPTGRPFFPVLGNAPLIRDLKRNLAASSMRVLDVLAFFFQPDTRVAVWEPLLALAAEFGATYVLVLGNDPDWSRMRDNLGGLCDLCAGHGLTVALEFNPARPLASLPQTVRLIEEAGRRNACVMLDPVHLIRSGGAPQDLARVDPALFPYAQISDGVLAPGEPNPAGLGKPMGPSQRRLFGEGTLPVHAFLAALPTDIPLSVEISDHSRRPMAGKAWALATMASTRQFLAAHRPVS